MIRASNSLEGIDENNATIGCPYCLPFCVTVILTQRGNLVAMPNIRGKTWCFSQHKTMGFRRRKCINKITIPDSATTMTVSNRSLMFGSDSVLFEHCAFFILN